MAFLAIPSRKAKIHMTEKTNNKRDGRDQPSTVYYLVQTYFPELLKLVGPRYNWPAENEKLFEKLETREEYLRRTGLKQYEPPMTFYDLLKKAYDGEVVPILLLKHMNILISEILAEVPAFQKPLREAFEGKFGNLSSLNYLNPFGEVSYMHYQMFSLKNQVLAIETPYPNGKPKDFLIQISSGRTKEIHEEVNIHCKLRSEASPEEILDDIIQKTKDKVLTETKGNFEPPETLLSFVVVLWHTNVDILRGYMAFFDRPNNTVIPEISDKYPIQGFYTYVKLGNEMKFINVHELKNLL